MELSPTEAVLRSSQASHSNQTCQTRDPNKIPLSMAYPAETTDRGRERQTTASRRRRNHHTDLPHPVVGAGGYPAGLSCFLAESC